MACHLEPFGMARINAVRNLSLGGTYMNSRLRRAFLVCLLVLLFSIQTVSIPAQQMEVIAGGELEFQTSCAVCHGVDARGQGIMTRHLTLAPANLRHLRQRNGGKFPFWEIYRVIEGRGSVPGHGSRDMPIWGDRFRADAGGDGKSAQTQAAGRILSVVFYLEHIQE
jgi:mono/diheme cytochrome c family protein